MSVESIVCDDAVSARTIEHSPFSVIFRMVI